MRTSDLFLVLMLVLPIACTYLKTTSLCTLLGTMSSSTTQKTVLRLSCKVRFKISSFRKWRNWRYHSYLIFTKRKTSCCMWESWASSMSYFWHWNVEEEKNFTWTRTSYSRVSVQRIRFCCIFLSSRKVLSCHFNRWTWLDFITLALGEGNCLGFSSNWYNRTISWPILSLIQP